VVFFNAVLAEMIMKPAIERRGSLIFVFLLFAVVLGYGLFELRGSREVYSQASERLKLALIQPNIDQMDKLNPRLIMPIYETQEKMTRQAAQSKPEIIIWPETAVFTYLLQDSRLFPRVQQLAREVNAWLIIGTPYLTAERKVYNSVVSISPSGEVISRYDKERLVPFGEYLPFRPLLYWLLKATGYHDQDFDPNPKPVPVVAGKYKIATAVCFESTFPGLVRQRAGKDSDFILTVTNDGWFGNSAAPYFHLNTGIFRAIENRKYFVQVGNTGFSAVIDPYGRILKRSRLNERVILF
jgi:apolipoprotein N-acyltransferase